MGVGLFLWVGVLSGDYGNFWDIFEWFQDSRTRGQLLGVSRNSGTVGKYECGSQDTTVSICIVVLEFSWKCLHQNRMNSLSDNYRHSDPGQHLMTFPSPQISYSDKNEPLAREQ